MTDVTQRDSYRHFTTITTRWRDNDLYGHVINVVYDGYFDRAANSAPIERGGLDAPGPDKILMECASS